MDCNRIDIQENRVHIWMANRGEKNALEMQFNICFAMRDDDNNNNVVVQSADETDDWARPTDRMNKIVWNDVVYVADCIWFFIIFCLGLPHSLYLYFIVIIFFFLPSRSYSIRVIVLGNPYFLFLEFSSRVLLCVLCECVRATVCCVDLVIFFRTLHTIRIWFECVENENGSASFLVVHRLRTARNLGQSEDAMQLFFFRSTYFRSSLRQTRRCIRFEFGILINDVISFVCTYIVHGKCTESFMFSWRLLLALPLWTNKLLQRSRV